MWILALAAGVAVAALIAETRRRTQVEKDLRSALAVAASAKAAEAQALNESSVRGQILTAMEDAVLLARGREIIYANPAAAALIGADVRLLPPWIEDVGSERPQRAQVTLHHPRRRDVRVVTAKVGDGALLAVIRDVTDEARLTAMRRDFVANASHEMKTPVGAILALAETLTQAIEDDPESARRFAGTLVTEARALRALLQGLLDLARLDAPTPGEETIDLSALVTHEVSRVRDTGSPRHLSIEETIEPEIEMRGRLEDIGLLVRNLISNAVRFTPDDGKVEVSLSRGGGQIRFAVSDTGHGIASSDLPRIFERFYRTDQARSRVTGGTGLGLAIARGVAEAHGGVITVESELGVGSTFTATFPV